MTRPDEHGWADDRLAATLLAVPSLLTSSWSRSTPFWGCIPLAGWRPGWPRWRAWTGSFMAV